MQHNPIIKAFLDEAESIARGIDFSSYPDTAMFWAHVDHASSVYSYEQNRNLCEIFMVSHDAYVMDSLRDFSRIERFFSHYAGDYPPGITSLGWDIFSRHFSEQASGDHAYVAVNDSKPDDYFIRIELPIMRKKFKRITAIEPAVSSSGSASFKTSTWSFSDWEQAQSRQWSSPGYYLDETPYPRGVVLPG